MFHKLKSVVQVMITIQINDNVYRKYADLILFVLLQWQQLFGKLSFFFIYFYFIAVSSRAL